MNSTAIKKNAGSERVEMVDQEVGAEIGQPTEAPVEVDPSLPPSIDEEGNEDEEEKEAEEEDGEADGEDEEEDEEEEDEQKWIKAKFAKGEPVLSYWKTGKDFRDYFAVIEDTKIEDNGERSYLVHYVGNSKKHVHWTHYSNVTKLSVDQAANFAEEAASKTRRKGSLPPAAKRATPGQNGRSARASRSRTGRAASASNQSTVTTSRQQRAEKRAAAADASNSPRLPSVNSDAATPPPKAKRARSTGQSRQKSAKQQLQDQLDVDSHHSDPRHPAGPAVHPSQLQRETLLRAQAQRLGGWPNGLPAHAQSSWSLGNPLGFGAPRRHGSSFGQRDGHEDVKEEDEDDGMAAASLLPRSTGACLTISRQASVYGHAPSVAPIDRPLSSAYSPSVGPLLAPPNHSVLLDDRLSQPPNPVVNGMRMAKTKAVLAPGPSLLDSLSIGLAKEPIGNRKRAHESTMVDPSHSQLANTSFDLSDYHLQSTSAGLLPPSSVVPQHHGRAVNVRSSVGPLMVNPSPLALPRHSVPPPMSRGSLAPQLATPAPIPPVGLIFNRAPILPAIKREADEEEDDGIEVIGFKMDGVQVGGGSIPEGYRRVSIWSADEDLHHQLQQSLNVVNGVASSLLKAELYQTAAKLKSPSTRRIRLQPGRVRRAANASRGKAVEWVIPMRDADIHEAMSDNLRGMDDSEASNFKATLFTTMATSTQNLTGTVPEQLRCALR